jgi:Zn-dependent protease
MNSDTAWQIALYAIPIIFAITLHEAAHAYVARYFGDHTASDLGRVTLNPLKHIDPFGTIIIPGLLLLTHAGVLFGYAKPVPVNFGGLKNPRRDMIWVAAAGPVMNIALALISALGLAVLDGMGVTPGYWGRALCLASIRINLLLAVFNLLPLPPLDGGRVMTGLLPPFLAMPYAAIERFGMVILIGLVVILPQLGPNMDVFGWLVQRPVAWLTQNLLAVVDMVARTFN